MNKLDRVSLLKIVYSLLAFCFFSYLGLRYMGTQDFSAVLTWWFTLLVLGLAVQPLAIMLFHRFHDGGWIFSKTLGIALCGWLMWFLSSCHILKFTRTNCWILLFVCLGLCVLCFELVVRRNNRKQRYLDYYTPGRLSSMLAAEAIFFAFLVAWCYIKGFNPDAYGTERFMDYSYMMSLSRTDYMPAKDVWLSGNSINYYYVGQYMATFITKISGLEVSYGYNLSMMMLAAFGFSLPYSLGANLMRTFIGDKQKQTISQKEAKRLGAIGSITEEDGQTFFRPVAAGILSGLAVSIAGNMHYPIYKYLYPKLQRMNGATDVYSYWFPDATRFIGYMPDTNDKTIHEFPIYSYVVGDLHAHVINTIFVLTVLAVLFAWLLRRKEKMDAVRRGEEIEEPNLLREVFQKELLLAAFFVGLFHMTNYWDFPIYFVVCGAVILFSNLVVYSFKKKAWILTAYQAALFVIEGILVSLPFTLTFDSISTAINFCSSHTSPYQLLVLWGLPVFCVAVYFGILICEHARAAAKNKKAGGEKKPWIRSFLEHLQVTDLFVLTIGLCAMGLVLLPELIYVKDIYSGAYQRANTMFKLTYQAFILFGLSMGYILVKYVSMPRTRAQKAFAVAGLLLFSTTLGYFNEALEAWFGGNYKTLDATTFIRDDCNEDDAEMIEYINENIPEQSVILEMCGLSYTYFNRISVFTGMETVLGWQTHEWLWRSSGTLDYPEIVSQRHNDIITIYTSTDETVVRKLIEQYKIDYIYIGECELVDGYNQTNNSDADSRYVETGYFKKIDTNIELLCSLGEVVKEIPAGNGKNYATYLIKVR